jgi:hypothetical protein
LIALQPLALERVEQRAFRLGIVAMHQTAISSVTIFWHRPANDDLEVRLAILPVTDIAAVKADDDAALRYRQLRPVSRTAINEAGPFLRQFCFGTLGHPQRVRAQGFGIGAGCDRQDIGEQTSDGRVGRERRPASAVVLLVVGAFLSFKAYGRD